MDDAIRVCNLPIFRLSKKVHEHGFIIFDICFLVIKKHHSRNLDGTFVVRHHLDPCYLYFDKAINILPPRSLCVPHMDLASL